MVRPGNRIQKLSPRGHFLHPKRVRKTEGCCSPAQASPGMKWFGRLSADGSCVPTQSNAVLG